MEIRWFQLCTQQKEQLIMKKKRNNDSKRLTLKRARYV